MSTLRFDSYALPHLQTLSDNFTDAITRTVRLPAAHGGYDPFGDAPAPNEIGQVRASGVLLADSAQAMQTQRDALDALRGWGTRDLFRQPTDPAARERFCRARVQYIRYSERPAGQSAYRLPYQIWWQVSDPRWQDTQTRTLDFSAYGTSSSADLTRSGGALALPNITLTALADCVDPTMERLDGGTTVDQVAFSGTLAAGSVLVVDAAAHRVTLDGVALDPALYTFTHPDLLRLPPATPRVQVRCTNESASAAVRVTWRDAWYG